MASTVGDHAPRTVDRSTMMKPAQLYSAPVPFYRILFVIATLGRGADERTLGLCSSHTGWRLLWLSTGAFRRTRYTVRGPQRFAEAGR